MKKRVITILCIAVGILFVSCKREPKGTEISQKKSEETQVVSLQTEKEIVTDTSEENFEKKILCYRNCSDQVLAEIMDEEMVQQIMDAVEQYQDWKIVPEKEYVFAEPDTILIVKTELPFIGFRM